MKKLSLILWFSLWASFLFAQGKKFTFNVTEEIVWAGVDRPGDLFILLASGEVQKFNNSGTFLAKHPFPFAPTLIDAGDGVTSFAYHRKESSRTILSSELDLISEIKVDPSFAISPWLVCPVLHELWIFDVSDYSLKKTKLRASTIAFESSLQNLSHTPEDFISLREYQNYLFLLDRKVGVHVFNGVGKFLRTLGEGGLDYFNFLGEEFYYIKGDELIFIDLYTEDKRNYKLPQACDRAFSHRQYPVCCKR